MTPRVEEAKRQLEAEPSCEAKLALWRALIRDDLPLEETGVCPKCKGDKLHRMPLNRKGDDRSNDPLLGNDRGVPFRDMGKPFQGPGGVTIFPMLHICWTCGGTGDNLRPTFCHLQPGEMSGGDNEEPASYRKCLPDSTADVGPFKVKRIFWRFNEYSEYNHNNSFWLLETEDSRYAFVSDLSGGTCGHCGSSSYDVAFGSSLEEVVRFGMDSESRKRAGLALSEDV